MEKWTTREINGGYYSIEINGRRIAQVRDSERTEANAERIVKAVNCHDAMVEALNLFWDKTEFDKAVKQINQLYEPQPNQSSRLLTDEKLEEVWQEALREYDKRHPKSQNVYEREHSGFRAIRDLTASILKEQLAAKDKDHATRIEALIEWIKTNSEWYYEDYPLGSFLTAIVKNDLMEAVLRADDTNIKALKLYAWFIWFIHWNLPADWRTKAQA